MKEASSCNFCVKKQERIPLVTLKMLQENYAEKATAAVLPETQAKNLSLIFNTCV